jgi:putative oxidoreductase
MAKTGSILGQVFSYSNGALVMRIVLGLIFITHGGQKIFGWPSPRTGWAWGGGWAATIEGMGGNFPEPLVMALMLTEFVGGIFIILGVLTRFWSAGLVIAMAVAAFAVHFPRAWDAEGVFVLTRLVDEVEFPLALLAMALMLFLRGPGRWAIVDVEGWLLKVKKSDD